MMINKYRHLLPALLIFLLSSCSFTSQKQHINGNNELINQKGMSHEDRVENLNKYLQSGTITLSFSTSTIGEYASFQFSDKTDHQNDHTNKNKFAPLIGFFPVTASFNPADNEVWVEIIKDDGKLSVFKGKRLIKSFSVQGTISLAEGQYPLQHKQKDPLWYAPDEYFEKRRLKVPPKGDHFRYRKGALGSYALYPTMDFVIHSGPFWNSEIGGIKLRETDLASIFSVVPLGAPIVVK